MPLRSCRPLSIAIVLGSLMLVLGTASASAAIRYAAPGGNGLAPCEDENNPCSIFAAASVEGPMPRAQANDDVILASGNYSDTAHDLGPNNVVRMVEGIGMHGIAGQPRPVIADGLNGETGLKVNPGDSVSRLEIQSDSLNGIVVSGGVVEEVIVRDDGPFFFACRQTGGIIRDSACLTSGSNGKAVGLANGAGPFTPVLRNVTARSTGPNSFGIFFRTINATGTLDAKSVIADGTAHDALANAEGVGSSSSINLEFSDFDTVEALPEAGGTASVTAPATPTNITAPPLLAIDGFHELAGSETIDKGAIDGSSGTTDIDGQPRTSSPDIGADERTATTGTKTTVACAPSSLEFGDPSTCTATVENSPAGGKAPGGSVEFASDKSADSFLPQDATCSLADEGGGRASCHLTFIATAPDLHPHTVAATYLGDGDHDPSVEATNMNVSKRSTSTRVACSPGTLILDGSGATCTATVENVFANPNAPTGIVNFFGSNGNFSEGGMCTLTDEGGGKASCHLTYSPRSEGNGRITAMYLADTTHQPSTAESHVDVRSRPTSTTLSCGPSALSLGAGAICTATVSDTSASPVGFNESIVKFASDSQGAFSNGAACTLTPASGGKASCRVTYNPSAVGSGSHKITASFQGDSQHDQSQGSIQIKVAAPPRPQAPNTMLKKRPKAKGAKRLATFTFASDQAGSTFQCKLDRAPFKPCRSPFTKKVQPGRHTFRVRAVNSAGLTDPTPAVFHWKVSPST